MIPPIGTIPVGAGSNPTVTADKISALSRQAGTLRQELARAHQAAPTVGDAQPSEAISQQLLSVQAQLNQWMLVAQLARLGTEAPGAGPGAAPQPSGSPTDATKPPRPSQRQAGPYDPYRPHKAPGSLVKTRT